MYQECRERFPRHRLQLKPLVSDPGKRPMEFEYYIIATIYTMRIILHLITAAIIIAKWISFQIYGINFVVINASAYWLNLSLHLNGMLLHMMSIISRQVERIDMPFHVFITSVKRATMLMDVGGPVIEKD